MKLAVIGGRDFEDYDLLKKNLDEIKNIHCIVSGGAKGADLLAEMYASSHDLPVKIFPANWDKYGKKAGFKRNKQIVEECDYLIAFWDGVSRGTQNSIELCEKNRVPYLIVNYDPIR